MRRITRNARKSQDTDASPARMVGKLFALAAGCAFLFALAYPARAHLPGARDSVASTDDLYLRCMVSSGRLARMGVDIGVNMRTGEVWGLVDPDPARITLDEIVIVLRGAGYPITYTINRITGAFAVHNSRRHTDLRGKCKSDRESKIESVFRSRQFDISAARSRESGNPEVFAAVGEAHLDSRLRGNERKKV